MAQPQLQTKSQTAVQEYMDTMLTDLFPPIPDEVPSQIDTRTETITEASPQTQVNLEVVTPDTATQFIANEPDWDTDVTNGVDVAVEEPQTDLPTAQLDPHLAEEIEHATETEESVPTAELDPHLAEEIEQVTEEQVDTVVETVTEPQIQVAAPEAEPEVAEAVPEVVQAVTEPVAKVDTQTETQIESDVETCVETAEIAEASVEREVGVPPQELKYPNAPDWAQEDFDVLLFDVCGLKLAVPMETLGRIIKVDHETNHLIGRPKWFMGAYNENEQNLYVVDTAQYIMPEKGFDLSRDGYEYIIQLQRSQWTLA